MLSNFLPGRAIQSSNPILLQELGRQDRFNKIDDLGKYNRILIIIPAAFIGWWFLERLHIGFQYTSAEWDDHLFLILLFINAGMTLISSFYTVVTSINTIRNRIDSGLWATLQTTPQSGENVIEAY